MIGATFWPLYAVLLGTMLLCRCVPIFVLNGRELSAPVSRALGTIPVAAFAALVANDLVQPELWQQGPWHGLMPILAAAVVAVCAVRTRSLALCALVGVVVYVVLGFMPF